MYNVALVPAYNEEKNIGKVIFNLKKYPNLIIIVVDDGSKDRTYEIAKKMGAIVIRHKYNKGKGEAIKTGINYIIRKIKKAKNVVLIDADMQYHPREASKMLKLLEDNLDIVIGMRNPKDIPYANRMGNFLWRVLFNFLFNSNFRDTNCGFMAIKRESLKKIRNIQGGYIIENSILKNIILNKLRYKQVLVNVVYKRRIFSKYARMFFGVLFFILLEGFKYRLGIK